MPPGARLETACHRSYESLLLRSRGYGMAKATLLSVASAEGSNLTALVKRVGRTPGAVRDYLGWLLDVGARAAAEDRWGRTPADDARTGGHDALARLLDGRAMAERADL